MSTAAGSHADPKTATAEPTLGRLVADASRDVSSLIQAEIALAKSEIRFSAKEGGIGAVLLAAAGVFGLLVLVLLSITIAWFLRWAGLDPWWAYLIVTALYLLVAALLGLLGIRRLKRVRPPEKTIETTKELPRAFKHG